MPSFIGNINTNNILHLYTGSRSSTDQSVGSDTIFHSRLPHVFILQTLSGQYQGMYGNARADVFSVPSQVQNWEAEGRVYFVEVTLSNGQKRYLSGSSSIQDSYVTWSTYMLDPAFGDAEFWVNCLPQIDNQCQQFWLGGSTSDIVAKGAGDLSIQGGGWVKGAAFDVWSRTNTQQLIKDKLQAQNWGPVVQDHRYIQKTHIAFPRPRILASSKTYTDASYFSGNGPYYDYWEAKLRKQNPFHQTSVSGDQQVYVTQVSFVLTNLLLSGSTIVQEQLSSDQGEIKISNSNFLIGGVDFRQGNLRMLQYQNNQNPQVYTQYNQSQTSNVILSNDSYNQGLDIVTFPANSSWELLSNSSEIKMNGTLIWGPSRIPLRFLENYSISQPQKQISTWGSHYLGAAQINTGNKDFVAIVQFTQQDNLLFNSGGASYEPKFNSMITCNPNITSSTQKPKYSPIAVKVGQYALVHTQVFNTQGSQTYRAILNYWLYNSGSDIKLYVSVGNNGNYPQLQQDAPLTSQQLTLRIARLL